MSFDAPTCPWCRSPFCTSTGCMAAHARRLERENASLKSRVAILEFEVRTLRERFNLKRADDMPEPIKRQRPPAPSVPARRQPVPISPGGWL